MNILLTKTNNFLYICNKKIKMEKETSIKHKTVNSYLGAVMPSFLAELKANWKPETKTETGYGYHGSSKGDEIEYTLYFDSYRCEWTTKDRAFQGLVFKEIDKFLK